MMNDLHRLTATEAAAAIARRELSSEELVRACLDRIEARNPDVKAWAYIDPDQAIRAARERDNEGQRGPLHGIPIGIKDMIDTADQPTQHNSPIYVGHRPGQDAAMVAILRAAGAVILGKTDTHEFAAGGRLPATRNPHNLAHTPGGSSSGSAAAVADDQVPLAFGTQTAGSTIRPASFCGIFAMKPTYGVVSREGAKLYSISLDTIGWFGRSVADLGLLADILAVSRQAWIPHQSVRGLKIAVCRTPYWSKASRASRAAVESAAEQLDRGGAHVTSLDLPPEFSAINDLQNIVMRGEGRAAFLAEYRRAYDLLSQEFRDRVEDADNISPQRLCDAQDALARLRPHFDALASDADAILTPAAIGEAPPLSQNTTGDPTFSRLWTALHVPCIALPWSYGEGGLPIGVQLVTRRYHDDRLLAVASAVEQLRGVDSHSPAASRSQRNGELQLAMATLDIEAMAPNAPQTE
jgi:Asp-tRNA(Asn)/Glu-tRNA(Gln) amidotransferase A subunit family amidase